MRTKAQYKRDNYYLNLIKEASIFTMMVYGFQNQTMMNCLGPIIPMMAVLFMLTPRAFINELLDKDAQGTREIKVYVIPEWKRNIEFTLNIIKFMSLIVLTLYIFLNQMMYAAFGPILFWLVSIFMIIPRKLFRIWLFEKESKETEDILD